MAIDGKRTTNLFSALEWKVVSLAMREANSGDERQGWLARLFQNLTGIAPKMPLADPRLETLRRFVCKVRARADIADMAARLQEFGYDARQIAAVAQLAR
ncbi:hypothetical protein [Sphingomonas montanisoli]|uniref:Uncharacterized protein n=1 Tax=Sphingomonas montanisoli TaxID=2606412 RepID=A0A5D9C8U4_9SPHN|nr:hypothetical protein [Sphingomonas montanisoli]TZG26405.1 hypothetical protein FYJ91_15870 [Sphingomonas montanisoli]